MNSITRKDFIKNSSLILASSNIFMPLANASTPSLNNHMDQRLIFKNVRLETGFEYENEEIVHTKTALFNIEIKGNKISKITENKPSSDAIDAKGYLMLPAFKDMHIHLDKTFYGGPWQAKSSKNRTVKDMIAYEQKILPQLKETTTFRAEKLIELLQSHGVNHARSHVNIDPTSKLDNLKNLEKAIEHKRSTFHTEIVAFPQHGVFSSGAEQLMRDAAKLDIDYIGGLDPFTIDGSIEKGIDFITSLALDNKKGIDIHLHESGESGLKTVEYIINTVNEHPQLKGKTFISHCFALAKLDQVKMDEIAEKLAHAQIGIISTVPFGRTIMPIPTLYKYGVDVRTGNDSIIDHWSTFGTGSILQKSNLMAQLYGYASEYDLSRCLKLATNNILPLDNKGTLAWPKQDDLADFVFVDASCSAEAVSRISPIKSLIHQGTIVY